MNYHPKDYEERRKSRRVDMEAERILLRWFDAQGSDRLDDGICIDLSRRGILIEHRQPLALGELVEITFKPGTENENTQQGQVCRCTERGTHSYHIAMQLI